MTPPANASAGPAALVGALRNLSETADLFFLLLDGLPPERRATWLQALEETAGEIAERAEGDAGKEQEGRTKPPGEGATDHR